MYKVETKSYFFGPNSDKSVINGLKTKLCKVAIIDPLSTSTFQYFYTDISAISVTFYSSVTGPIRGMTAVTVA